LSAEPEASSPPPNEASTSTELLWPVSVRTHVPVSISHTRTVLSREPEASTPPPNEASTLTEFAWPVSVRTHVAGTSTICSCTSPTNTGRGKCSDNTRARAATAGDVREGADGTADEAAEGDGEEEEEDEDDEEGEWETEGAAEAEEVGVGGPVARLAGLRGASSGPCLGMSVKGATKERVGGWV
jgi:hypothetical protein